MMGVTREPVPRCRPVQVWSTETRRLPALPARPGVGTGPSVRVVAVRRRPLRLPRPRHCGPLALCLGAEALARPGPTIVPAPRLFRICPATVPCRPG